MTRYPTSVGSSYIPNFEIVKFLNNVLVSMSVMHDSKYVSPVC